MASDDIDPEDIDPEPMEVAIWPWAWAWAGNARQIKAVRLHSRVVW